MGRLIIFDTSNFCNYPVGGQITSIKNFMKYIGEYYPQKSNEIFLVGVSTIIEDVGKVQNIRTEAGVVLFLAVTLANQNLNSVKKSLRVEYLKGLYKYRKKIRIKREDCVYLHTPEAFAFTRITARKSPCFVFSHGSFFNMLDHVRFFKNSNFILSIFRRILLSIIKNSTGVFVLDRDTEQKYRVYSNNIFHVGNSIVCNSEYTEHFPNCKCPKLIFVGRLSSVKNIVPIIEATKKYSPDCRLEIIGAGELMDDLKDISNYRITFMGSIVPEEVKSYMKKADILIMNSLHEGVPMTILEAMSMSLPVVTTDVGGIGEVVQYGTDAEKTDGTSESIIAAIEKIMSNYNEYSKNAYNHSQKFDYRKVNKKIFEELNLYLKW